MGALHTHTPQGNVAFPTSPLPGEGNRALGLPPGHQGRRGQSWTLNPALQTGTPSSPEDRAQAAEQRPRWRPSLDPGSGGGLLLVAGSCAWLSRAAPPPPLEGLQPGPPSANPGRGLRGAGSLPATPSPGRALLHPLRPTAERPCSGQGNPRLWTHLPWVVWAASPLHFCKCLRLELAGRLPGA